MRLWKILVAAILTLAVGNSCVRQELEDPNIFLAYIPVSIDWSNSLLDLDDVGNVSIYFYPKDGSDLVVRASDNLYYNLVALPVGEYSVLIFNDLKDNVTGVDFNNSSSYDDFTINITENEGVSPTFYDMTSDEVLASEHSRMAVWYMDNFSVTESMVEYTRSLEFQDYMTAVEAKAVSRNEAYIAAKSTESSSSTQTSESADTRIALPESKNTDITDMDSNALEDLSNIEMAPKTTIMNFRVRVVNLNSAMYFKTIARGTANGSYLSREENISIDGSRHIYDVLVDNREYDDPTNGIDGYVNFSINTFGREPDNEEYTLSFRIILYTGEMMEFERDITEQVKTSTSHTIEVDLTADLEQLVLLEYSEPGLNVNNWGNDITIYL